MSFAAIESSASAQQCVTTNIGGYSYTNCSDGSSATQNRIGGQVYTNINPGYAAQPRGYVPSVDTYGMISNLEIAPNGGILGAIIRGMSGGR
jgi:hypothetical protein